MRLIFFSENEYLYDASDAYGDADEGLAQP